MPCNKGCDICDSSCDVCGYSTKSKQGCFGNYRQCDNCRSCICFECFGINDGSKELYELYKKHCIKNNKPIFSDEDRDSYGITDYNDLNNCVELFQDEGYEEDFLQNNFKCLVCKNQNYKDLKNIYQTLTCIITVEKLQKYKKLEEENKKLKLLLLINNVHKNILQNIHNYL